jgi:hypothetical protein
MNEEEREENEILKGESFTRLVQLGFEFLLTN